MKDDFNRADAETPLLALSRSRLVLMAAVFMVGYLAVCLRLADLTLLRGVAVTAAQERKDAAARPDIKPLERPLRAEIVDRNGVQLATSLAMASVYADATLADDPKGLAAALAGILPGQDEGDLAKKLSSGKKFVWIQRDVTPKQEYAINALGSPALNFQQEDRRIYPSGSLAAHVTGYTDVDGAGISGAEKAFDATLRKGGAPVRLTLDLRLQHVLRRELSDAVRKFSAKGAAGMVMDVNTGEILAMVSLPDFDPHHPGEADADGRFNRASLGVFEMGSTFKLFSTAAALDSGSVHFGTVIDAVEPIRHGRFTISDYHPKKRNLTVPEIFIYSSNIGTARMAMTVGTQGLQDFYRRLGFMDQAPLELPERGAPLYPKPWRDVSTLTTSFGHGIAVTPVHLVRAASALVNGGILVTPTLLRARRIALEPQGPRVVSPATSGLVRDLLSLTVAAGTGENARAEGYDVGGKTGTAEKNQGGRYVKSKVMSSFIGVFPMHAPRYAVLAMIDEPQPIRETHGFVTGGWTAAPVVGAVIAQGGPLLGLAPAGDYGAEIARAMAPYLKEMQKGGALASVGTDH